MHTQVHSDEDFPERHAITPAAFGKKTIRVFVIAPVAKTPELGFSTHGERSERNLSSLPNKSNVIWTVSPAMRSDQRHNLFAPMQATRRIARSAWRIVEPARRRISAVARGLLLTSAQTHELAGAGSRAIRRRSGASRSIGRRRMNTQGARFPQIASQLANGCHHSLGDGGIVIGATCVGDPIVWTLDKTTSRREYLSAPLGKPDIATEKLIVSRPSGYRLQQLPSSDSVCATSSHNSSDTAADRTHR
jgi:hypothetical protein